MRFLQSFCSCFFVSSDRSSYRDSALVLVQATFQILSISTNIHSFFFLQIECRVIIISLILCSLPSFFLVVSLFSLFFSWSLFFSFFLLFSLYLRDPWYQWDPWYPWDLWYLWFCLSSLGFLLSERMISWPLERVNVVFFGSFRETFNDLAFEIKARSFSKHCVPFGFSTIFRHSLLQGKGTKN